MKRASERAKKVAIKRKINLLQYKWKSNVNDCAKQKEENAMCCCSHCRVMMPKKLHFLFLFLFFKFSFAKVCREKKITCVTSYVWYKFIKKRKEEEVSRPSNKIKRIIISFIILFSCSQTPNPINNKRRRRRLQRTSTIFILNNSRFLFIVGWAYCFNVYDVLKTDECTWDIYISWWPEHAKQVLFSLFLFTAYTTSSQWP